MTATETAVSAKWESKDRVLIDGPVPRVMGIVNVTPDSFSDGGRWADHDAAVAHGKLLAIEGADLLDVGGESTRPGSDVVPAAEELRRVVPVVERLAPLGVPISIDTMKPEVARAALAAGAVVVNDVSGLRDDRMAEAAAEFGAAVVVMHMRGTPRDMQDDPRYDDVVAEVFDYLAGRIRWCESRGIPRSRIAIDPGIGFGKTFEHNVDLLRGLDRFATLDCALAIGISRKGLLKKITGKGMALRLTASVVASLAACTMGAKVARVHDVGPMVDAIKVWGAIRGWG